MERVSTVLSQCYGDEGRRLSQLFQLAFVCDDNAGEIDEMLDVDAILLSGDSGTGKTTALELLAKAHGLEIRRAELGLMAAEWNGLLGKGLEHLAWEARKTRKVLKLAVIIEDIDLFCPRKGEVYEDSGFTSALQRLVSSLQKARAKPGSGNKTVLVATSRNPSSIACSVRALFQIPTPDERLQIFRRLVESLVLDPAVDLASLNAQAHSFVAADLAHWCRLAEEATLEDSAQTVSTSHFERTLGRIRLSGFQNATFTAEKPEPVRWSDIGGLTMAKRALEEAVVWVYRHADAYRRLGIRPSKGILLYGPPGTGKTLLARAIATESSANFMSISIPDLVKGEVGESEKAVSAIFRTAIRCSPCVVFLDELEAIFSSRESSGDAGKKLISQFLIEMDYLDKSDQNVILLGATNYIQAIDPSITRPGRLDRLVYVDVPNKEERIEILRVLQRQTRLAPTVRLETVAESTENYTGADLKAVMRKAGLLALKRRQRASGGSSSIPLQIEEQDLREAIQTTHPSSVR